MIDIDLNLLRVYRVEIGFIWFEPRLGGRRRAFDAAPRSFNGRGAAEDQTRQCQAGSAIGAVASFATTWLTQHG